MDKCKSLIAIVVAAFIVANQIYSTRSEKPHNATRTDLTQCKLTQFGTEFQGPIAKTGGSIRCQFWNDEEPLHKINPSIKDSDFPERSMKIARNYCRNPTRDPKGPWCYTVEPTLIDDECGIPLCNYGECRISGTGAEYGGSRKTSVSGKKCKSWDKRHKLPEGRTEKYRNNKFADLSREKAKTFCRNPNDDTGGPWCYVEEENYETVEKEYCDIPFCDDKDCLVYVRNSSVYSTITKLNETYGNITLWMKLWNPMDEQNGEARILLSLLPIPTSSKKIAQDWNAGVEILISNAGSGPIYPKSDDEQDLENTPNIILGSKWSGLWINWGGGFVSVGLYGSTKAFLLQEYKKKNTISSLYPDSFLYYGLMGTGVLWSTEFCQRDCEIHTTFGMEFLRVWPIQPSNITYDIRFTVRASKDIAIRLYQSPGTLFPCFTVSIGHAETITLVYQENEKSSKRHLKDAPGKSLLDFWSWKDFTLSIFGPHLRLFSERIYGNEEVLYVKDDLFGTVRWFSVGSSNNIAYWAFYCVPESNPAENPSPPNCIANLADYRYEGSQWTSVNEMPCIPWTSLEVPGDDKKDDLFVEGSIIKAKNQCRNPSRDPEGPYCYSMSLENSLTVSKQYCPIRICRSSDCRMAGTANDYIGTLATTRSGRTCAEWLSDYHLDQLEKEKIAREKELGIATATSAMETETFTTASTSRMWQVSDFESQLLKNLTISLKPPPDDWMNRLQNVRHMGAHVHKAGKLMKPIHNVNPEYFNDTLYPEQSARNASNYCRDPSRNIAGTWCYTTDPLVPQDLCDVRDCEKPEECTFLVRGHGLGRRLYVLPEHRSEGLHFSLKAWEPDNPDSITFVFTADDGFKSRYILKVGALDNEKVLLYYQGEEGGIELVKKKTLPHLLYLGKWSSFVIKIPRGQVLLYYQGAPSPLFQWHHPEPAKAFLPIYYYYTSERSHTIGVFFDCATRCHIENTQTERFSRILPLSIWSKRESANPNRLELMIRAEGVVLIPLLLLPTTPGYYGLTLGEMGQWIFFIRNTYPNMRIYHKQKAPASLFTTNSWTNITIMWLNNTINVLWNGTQVFHYEHTKPLIFYYFSLAVDRGGWATWTANCIPSDIDGDPEDGGWSEWGPWACSASCNGGVGTRKRLCNNPEPNVKGEPCLGPNIMSGRCNTIKCGDITEDTVSLIKRRIKRNHTSLSVKEGHEITIPSDSDIIKVISTESADSEIEWSHNGIFVYPDNERLEIEDDNIVIRKAEVNDSGVYAITLRRVDGTHMVLKMVTLVVYPVKTVVTVRETLSITVKCNCVILGYLYSDLKVSWTIDKTLWKNYGTTLPISVNVDIVPAVNVSHKGLWECVVQQEDLGFKWTTNAILVNVIGPPNWRTHLMEDKLTKPIFGWMPNETFVAISALIIFIISTVCIIIGTGFYIKFKESGKHREKNEASEILKKSDVKPSLPLKDVKTIDTQHEDEKRNRKKRLKSKIKSKIRRFRDPTENHESRKLMTKISDAESS